MIRRSRPLPELADPIREKLPIHFCLWKSFLPLPVALAVWEFCSGPLREDPRRVGKPLGRELAGYFSARRGAYRVIYRLVDEDAVIHVVGIEHRADVYRRR